MPCVDTEQSDVNDIEGMLVREKNLCSLEKKKGKKSYLWKCLGSVFIH